MGHHINDHGQFQSDLHPELPPDKITLSFKDAQAWGALAVLAMSYDAKDPDLARDIRFRLTAVMAADAGLSVEGRK